MKSNGVQVKLGTKPSVSQSLHSRIAILHQAPLMQYGIRSLLEEHLQVHPVAYCGASAQEAQLALPSNSQALVVIDDQLAQPARILEMISRFSLSGASVVVLCSPGRAPALHALLDAGANALLTASGTTEDLLAACTEVLKGNLWISRVLMDGLAQDAPRIELSEQQRRALALYTSGMTMDAVGRHMGISTSTAKDYIDRVRAKYVKSGIQPRTKTELYVAAKRDGLIA